jgi:phage shock protein C
MKIMGNKLRRVGKVERRIFGVCGGISRFIDPELDPVLIRLLWVVLTLFSPVMLVLYLILAVALKVDENPYEFDSSKYVKENKEIELRVKGEKVDIDEDIIIEDKEDDEIEESDEAEEAEESPEESEDESK